MDSGNVTGTDEMVTGSVPENVAQGLDDLIGCRAPGFGLGVDFFERVDDVGVVKSHKGFAQCGAIRSVGFTLVGPSFQVSGQGALVAAKSCQVSRTSPEVSRSAAVRSSAALSTESNPSSPADARTICRAPASSVGMVSTVKPP